VGPIGCEKRRNRNSFRLSEEIEKKKGEERFLIGLGVTKKRKGVWGCEGQGTTEARSAMGKPGRGKEGP